MKIIWSYKIMFHHKSVEHLYNTTSNTDHLNTDHLNTDHLNTDHLNTDHLNKEHYYQPPFLWGFILA